ncbi:MAG: DGQHR domain-containing protein [Deltaproteobacteria bacterium]|nr:DGQHR domain-containing protein [Deltaproteobacteria bacterium]
MAKAKKRSKKKLTEQEKEQRLQKQEIRRLLHNIGFSRVTGISGKEFVYDERTSEIDDAFHYENILLLIEYTTQAKPGNHLIGKKIIYDKINLSHVNFIEFLLKDNKFKNFAEYFNNSVLKNYTTKQIQVRTVYCSRHPISKEHRDQINGVCLLNYPIVKYFERIAKAIKRSARYEFFQFLKTDYNKFSENITRGHLGSNTKFSGHILPEEHSKYKEGYKIISFYIDAASLMQRAYVLRRDGWNNVGTIGFYQRMFSADKISKMRSYLYEKDRVFVNNIIAVLPREKIKLYGENKKEISVGKDGNFINTDTTSVQPTLVEIDNDTNIIGIVDGQHRLYSYHEGTDKFEEKIARLRKVQNLLVTGILYPETENKEEKLKFEAELFLEINSNQTNAGSELKQEIELMIAPFSSISVAKSILNALNESGPLENLFEQHFYEKGRLKTASIISYGLKPLVKFDGDDSLYKIWTHPDKSSLINHNNYVLLNAYKEFCVDEIRKIFIGFKNNVDGDSWTSERLNPNGILRVTAINGIINCLRLLIENDKTEDMDYYKKKLKGIAEFPFKDYKSSQYRKMGEEIYRQFFNDGKI